MDAKLTDLCPPGRARQLAPGAMSSNEQNPQPKNGEGSFKNNRRDDFLSRRKVGVAKTVCFFSAAAHESLRPRGLGSALHKPPIKLSVIAP